MSSPFAFRPSRFVRSPDARCFSTPFAFKLLSQFAKQNPARNIFFSPASIMFCLLMLYEGAGGKTRDQMADALEISKIEPESFRLALGRLKSNLESHDPDLQLLLSNCVWCHSGVKIEADYVARAQQVYDAQVYTIDFESPDAVGWINAWIHEKTLGKISGVLDSLPDLAGLIAINAIYLKAAWFSPFDRKWTVDAPFTTAANETKLVRMMRSHDSYVYYEEHRFQAVAVPYCGNLAMYVVLPSKVSKLDSVVQFLTRNEWETLLPKMRQTDGTVGLPRFTLDHEADLKSALAHLGMVDAFDLERANFNGIVASPLQTWVDGFMHRALVLVNEEGTTATALSATSLLGAELTKPQPFQMIVDRPFLFIIRHEITGTILFMGIVNDPLEG